MAYIKGLKRRYEKIPEGTPKECIGAIYSQRYRARYPTATAAATKRYRNKYPSRSREIYLKSKFGLTVDQWQELFVAQNYCCAACGTTDPGHPYGWTTDHDHNKKKGEIGFIRGILCHSCNRAAHVNATPRALRLLALYLEKYNG
jgi:hypothetical protein